MFNWLKNLFGGKEKTTSNGCTNVALSDLLNDPTSRFYVEPNQATSTGRLDVRKPNTSNTPKPAPVEDDTNLLNAVLITSMLVQDSAPTPVETSSWGCSENSGSSYDSSSSCDTGSSYDSGSSDSGSCGGCD